MPDRAAGTRTIALVGPGGAGKTSLAEALLFAAGTTTRQGAVADGTSVGDSSPEARARGFPRDTGPEAVGRFDQPKTPALPPDEHQRFRRDKKARRQRQCEIGLAELEKYLEQYAPVAT